MSMRQLTDEFSIMAVADTPRIPGKHGARAVAYAMSRWWSPMSRGPWLGLLVSAGEAGVNVEDISSNTRRANQWAW